MRVNNRALQLTLGCTDYPSLMVRRASIGANRPFGMLPAVLLLSERTLRTMM